MGPKQHSLGRGATAFPARGGRVRIRGAIASAGLGLLIPWLTACGDEHRLRTIETSLAVSVERPDLRLRASSAERFGFDVSKAQQSSGLTWETPAGWTALPSTTMRVANFRIGGDERAECYVTQFPGDGGGTLANVNRWRQQLGRDDLSPAQLDAMPRIPMLGGEAVLIEIEGSLKTGEAASGDGALLFGAVASLRDRTVFVKFTGPRERVEPERESFRAFCGSLRQAK